MDSRDDSIENGTTVVEGKRDLLQIIGPHHFSVVAVLSRSGKHY